MKFLKKDTDLDIAQETMMSLLSALINQGAISHEITTLFGCKIQRVGISDKSLMIVLENGRSFHLNIDLQEIDMNQSEDFSDFTDIHSENRE